MPKKGVLVDRPDQKISLFPGLEITSDDVFMDVGCGTGQNCRAAARVGADVIAIDISPDYVRDTKAACQGSNARSFRGIVTDCDPIPLPDATASVIISLEVIEHVEDPSRFLGELLRVGRPGALYALSVPTAPSESLMKVVAPASYFEPPEHLRIFDRQAFLDLISQSGFEIEVCDEIGAYWSIWWALRMASGTDHCPQFTTEPPPVLKNWEATWSALQETPQGPALSAAFDRILPKSYRVLARKPSLQ